MSRSTHTKSISRRRSRAREESGAALVETALILPVVLVLLFGMLDFGKAVNGWINSTHLANQAARFAAVNKNPGAGTATLQQYVQAQADTAELRNGGTSSVPTRLEICLSFPNGTSNVGDPVRATATFTYNLIPLVGSWAGIGSKTFSTTATMRLEAVPTTYTAGC